MSTIFYIFGPPGPPKAPKPKENVIVRRPEADAAISIYYLSLIIINHLGRNPLGKGKGSGKSFEFDVFVHLNLFKELSI